MADIKRLLNKKDWTGRELGMLELYNMAVTFKQTLDGSQDPKPVIARSEFQQMVNGIKDPEQGRVYNGYISIHEWLVVAYNIAQTQFQQAQLRFTELQSCITQAIIAEDVFRYVAQLPYIVTKKQYERLKAERIEAYFKDDSGEELCSNVFNLVERGISYYLNLLKANPKKPNPLKAIKRKYSAQPVKSKLILDRYNEITGRGYFTLEDGRRSDSMSVEEWQDAITTETMKETLTKIKSELGGSEYVTTLAEERAIAKAKALFEGKTEEQADKEQAQREYEAGLSVPAKWTQYTDPPEGLTKWDFIADELLLDFYPASLDGDDAYTDKNFTASMQDFYNEFKELVDVILKDMETRYFKNDDTKLSKLKLSEWGTTTISWRDLYDLDFYGERAKAESDLNIFDGNKRAVINGVAIVRPSDLIGSSPYIDKESGDYKAPELSCRLDSGSLEAYFTEAEDYADNVERIEDARKTLKESFYFVRCFNYIISLIAAEYSVPELDVFSLPIKILERRIFALNSLVPVLYKQIMQTDYGDKKLQAKKMQVLVDNFQPIEYERLVVPEADQARLKELIQNFQTFKANSHELLYFMHKLPSGEGESV